MPASKRDVKRCQEIHETIDELIPRHYANEIQRRLRVKGIRESISRIQNTRSLRNRDLTIMLELEAYCQELYPEEFN
jgi:hypothetical protein